MERLPTSQLREWLAYFHLEDEAAQDRALEAQANARANAIARRPRRGP